MDRRSIEPLWTPVDVAAKRSGPPCRRAGRHLRYEPNAVRTWF